MKNKTMETVKGVRMNECAKLQDATNSQEQEQGQGQGQVQEQEQFADKGPHMLYKINSADGYERSSSSLSELWEKVFEAVQKARAAHNMPPLPQHTFDMISGLQLVGLKNNGLRYMMEQLPGAARCIRYKRGFHREPETGVGTGQRDSGWDNGNENCGVSLPQPLPQSREGAIRCMPVRNGPHNHPYDMFSWLASSHRKPDYSIQAENDLSSR